MNILRSLAMLAISISIPVALHAEEVKLSPGDAIVHAGKLIAVPGRPAQTNVTIVIKEGRISAIRSGLALLRN
jgi:hypothetical protein